jgi:hypothetical protein
VFDWPAEPPKPASPLVAAAVNDGIGFELARTWPGDRHTERRLHRFKNSGARLCPICAAERASTDVGALTRRDRVDERS